MDVPVYRLDEFFAKMDVERKRKDCFQENALPEQMMRDTLNRSIHKQGSEKGDFIDVVHNHVVALFFEPFPPSQWDMQIKYAATAMSDDSDPIPHFFRFRTLIAVAEQRYLVAAGCDPLEDFVEMDLGSTCERICDILPVKYEYFQCNTALY